MLFLTIFGEVMFQLMKIKTDCFHFDQIHTWHRCLKLPSSCTSMWGISVKTVPPGKAMSKIIFTTPLTIYNSSELINSALFSRANQAFMFSSASYVKFIQLSAEMLQQIKRFSHPICRLLLLEKWFISFTFFFTLSIMCRRVFNKTIILLELDMKWS